MVENTFKLGDIVRVKVGKNLVETEITGISQKRIILKTPYPNEAPSGVLLLCRKGESENV